MKASQRKRGRETGQQQKRRREGEGIRGSLELSNRSFGFAVVIVACLTGPPISGG